MPHVTIIKPEKGFPSLNIRELFEFRELIGFLAWRDILSQYKQAFFGLAWAVIRPLFAILVYTFIFGKIAGFSSNGVPYPLFTLSGVVAWNLFATSLDHISGSLIANSNLLTKVYFPRLIIPLSSLGRSFVDFFISMILLFLMMLIYRTPIQYTILLFPGFFIIGLLLALGVGFFTSALYTRYRDIRYAMPFLLQMLFWLTPVAYGLENIPLKFQFFFYINPVTWIIQGFRWSLLGVSDLDLNYLFLTALFSLIVFYGGLYYFRRVEREMADII